MDYRVAPVTVRGDIVTRYAALAATGKYRCVVVTAQSDTVQYNVFTLKADSMDGDWEIEGGTLDLSEIAALSTFRTYEQRG